MREIPITQKYFQATGHCNGEKTLTMSDLQCSCVPYRTNLGKLETCIYKDERREIKTHTVRLVETDMNDPHQINYMKVKYRKDELKARSLLAGGVKVVLIEQPATYLDADHTAVNYDLIESEEQSMDCDNLN